MGDERNKRRSNRLSCFVPVEGKRGTAFDHIKTVDFSKGGLGFVSEAKIPLGKEIAIEILLGLEQEPVYAIGEIRWVKKVSGKNSYRLGVYFKEVLSGGKNRLNKFFSHKE
ncbi:MAG TPA: PilZ domain-containing protein [Candidatus Omnitrophota bacterium]|nr:PilZ domain-containing protein [Candidatus Omnitrophota bacterium]